MRTLFAPRLLATFTSYRTRSLALALIATCGAIGAAWAQTGSFADWHLNGSGNWGDPARWTAATPADTYPSGVGATAVLVHDVTGTRTISLLDAAGTSPIDVTLGSLVMGDTNGSSAIILGSISAGGALTFDNAGAANTFGTAGALLDHQYRTSANGVATATDPFKQPSSSDRIDAEVILNDDLTILASRSVAFYNAWTGNGHNLTLDGLNTNRILWTNNTTTAKGSLSGINVLNIWNGEARFDGLSGVADSQHIGAATINLGDGLVTTSGKTAFDGFLRVFPRLYMVNTDSVQTANLNLNGGWLINDLGSLTTLNGDGIEFWTGTITVTGAATTNLIDVNDAGTAEVHYVPGAIQGTGGFSKVNTGSLHLTADNTLSGDVHIYRGGPGGSSLAAKGAIALSGPNRRIFGSAEPRRESRWQPFSRQLRWHQQQPDQ